MANKKVAARTLDFSNVKESSGINPKHLEEGEYLATISEVRDDPAKDGEAMWNWIIQLDDHKSATYPYYVKLVENQLWKMRNLFIAAGIDVPKRAAKIDPNKVVGKTVCVVLEDDEYDGKTKSVISAVMPKEEHPDYAGTGPVDDDEDEDDEEEEVAPVKRGRGRPKKVVEPEEDEDDEEDDEDEEPAPKVSKRTAARRAKKAAVEEEEEDDDDEEEEEEPAPKKRKAKAAPAKKRRKAADDDEDDLDLDL